MWTGIALMRERVGQVLAVLHQHGPMERIDAAVAAHLRYSLGISDYTTAAIRNAGQVPDDIRIRYSAEAAKYGEVWRRLLQDAAHAGLLHPGLEPRAARMLVLGALNWAAEWWDPHRGPLDRLVGIAQSLVRGGLSAAPRLRSTPGRTLPGQVPPPGGPCPGGPSAGRPLPRAPLPRRPIPRSPGGPSLAHVGSVFRDMPRGRCHILGVPPAVFPAGDDDAAPSSERPN